MNNILIIDDNIDILDVLALMLGKHLQDCNILKATNGREGAEIMSSVPVALVLTDLQMPVMDGYGMIEFRNRNYPLVPVIAMSGSVMPGVREKLRALRVLECFEKPVDFGRLIRHIAGALGIEPWALAMLARPACDDLPHRVAGGPAAAEGKSHGFAMSTH